MIIRCALFLENNISINNKKIIHVNAPKKRKKYRISKKNLTKKI